MKTTRRIYACILAVLLLLPGTGVTATSGDTISYMVSPDYANNMVTISGTIPERDTLTEISICVLADGEIMDEVDANPTSQGVVYLEQMSAKDSFSFQIEYDQTHKESYFQMIAEGCVPVSGKLSLVQNSEYQGAIDAINRMVANKDVADGVTDKVYTDEEFAAYLKSDGYLAGISDAVYGEVGYTDQAYIAAAKKIRAELLANPMTVEGNTADVAAIQTYFVMEGLNSGVLPGLQSCIRILPNAAVDTAMKQLFQTVITGDAADTYFVSKVSGKNLQTVEQLKTELQKGLIFTAVRHGDGIAPMMTALSDYGSLAGITSVTEARCRGILGKDFADLSALKTAYEAVSSQQSGGSSGGGGGASGGGGFGSGGNGFPGITMRDPIGIKQDTLVPVTNRFEDIGGYEWASTAIIALADKGIIAGKSEGIFAPEDMVLREEFVKMLVGAVGIYQEAIDASAFDDVTPADWSYSYVNLAYKHGLCQGIGERQFGKGQTITRQDLCVMVSNALAVQGETDAAVLPFEDADRIADYAQDAVTSLYSLGVINGVSETEFNPTGVANRAEAAKIIYGVLKYL